MRRGWHRLSWALIGALAVLAVVATGSASATSLPSTADDHPWLLDGDVYALARAGDTLYLGGGFRYAGPRLPGLAKLDAATGSPDLGFPSVGDGYVRVIEPDGVGGWYVGGSFRKIGGVARSSLAHVLADGRVDPAFAPAVMSEGTEGEVGALALVGATLYVGGGFTRVAGQSRASLAAVDWATGAPTAWAPQPDGDISALEAAGGRLFAGGSFSAIAGTARSGLAAFEAGGALTGWAPALDEPRVTALEASATTLYVAGEFTQVGPDARGRLAAFDLAAGTLTAWAPSASRSIAKLSYAAATDTVYTSGDAAWIGSSFCYLAALDAQTGAMVPGAPWTGSYTTATVAGGTLYIAATFDVDPGITYDSKPSLMAIDLATGEERFRAGMPGDDGGKVRAIAVQGGDVAAGGWFASIGGVDRDRLAAVDLASDELTAWDPGADAPVRALALSGATVIAGGEFTHAGGLARSRLAAIDAAGAATAWNPGADAPVRALALDGGTAYVGGSFAAVGGQPRHGAAAVALADGAVQAWAPEALGGGVLALARRGATTFLGGAFATVGGEPHARLAAVDAAGEPLDGFAAQPGPGDVRALLVDGDTLYAGGAFTTMNGEPRRDVAAVDAGTGALTSWDARMSEGIAVQALAATADDVYVGGARTPDSWDADEAIFARLRKLDGARVQALPPVDSVIHALLAGGSSVLIGGSFHWVEHRQHRERGFASFTLAPASTTSPSISDVGGTLTCSTGSWEHDPLTYAYEWRRDGVAIATGPSYAVAPQDAGHALTCAVTARNLGGAAAAESGPAGGPPPPVSVGAPSIAGTPEYEQTLTCLAGDWSGAPTAYEFRWLRGGDDIDGETAATYRVTGADADRPIACRVVAVGPGGRAAALAPAVTPPPAPALLTAPALAGTALPGETLTCQPGTWSTTTALSYRYEWWSGSDVVGTDPQYAVREADRGTSVFCWIVARNGGGEASAMSNALVVPLLPPANLVAPRVVGTALAGRTVSCDQGAWTGAAGFRYEWTVGGEPRWSWPGDRLMLEAGDRGAVVSCAVVAHNADWVEVTARSAAVVVGWDPPAATAAPQVHGAAALGAALTCTPGVWTDAASLALSWLRDGAAVVATGAAYAISAADLGHALTCRVAASGPGGVAVADSAALAVPRPRDPDPPAPSATPAPTATPAPLPPAAGPSERGDTLTGTGRADVLHGLGGADRISGGAGADRLFGDAGDDVLVGGPGRDVLDGGRGRDTLDARDGAGGDRLTCGAGRDVAKADRGDRVARDCETVRRARS